MEEQITINGIVYHRLYVMDPVSQARGVTTVPHLWKHDECEGVIYIGSNAHLYCSGCGREIPVVYSRWRSPLNSYNAEDYYISFKDKGSVISALDLVSALTLSPNT